METPNPVSPHDAQKTPDIAGSAALITIDRLKQYPLLAKLPDSTLSKLQLHVREERFSAGQLILRAGAYNTDAYYLADGTVEVSLPKATMTAAVRSAPARSIDPARLDRLSGMLGSARRDLSSAAQEGGTVILSDMSFDVKVNERVVLERGEVFGEMSAISR